MGVQIWSLNRIIKMLTAILLNKFDAIVIIEGSRGLGKSTLSYHLAVGVSREFARLMRFEHDTVMYYYELLKAPKGISLEEFVTELIELKEKKAYRFNPEKVFLYQRKEILRFFHSWQRIGIGDEFVNAAFNRDFYNEEQKDLIKLMNMNRDHNNLFISCIPQFQNLDSQIKNLCKIRLSVVRRGVAVIQTPNRTIYSKDKWDQATNEKIEKDWIKKGIQNPHYSKLTTFRGIVRFPPLTRKQESVYQTIKDDKRNIVAREQMGLVDEEEKDPLTIAIELLEKGRIRNSMVLDGMAMSNGKDPDGFKRSIMNRLKKIGKPHQLTGYYWDKKGRKAPDVETEESDQRLKDALKIFGNAEQKPSNA